jgi:hypothetical protein
VSFNRSINIEHQKSLVDIDSPEIKIEDFIPA